MRLPLHEDIISKITELSLAGANQKHIVSEVNKFSAALIEGLGLKGVDASDPRFHPSEESVSYWRRQAHIRQRFATLDHTSVQLYIQQRKAEYPSDNWFFRMEDKTVGKDMLLVVQVGALWL